MTDRYPYPEIRKNDTITRLSRETEAGFTRSEYQQVVYCAGEANPTEPIWFGRAYDRPPFFTYSAVAKNNEVVVTPFPCGDVTDRAAGMTIGVSEWIRDAQGMYVGAHLWYKVQKQEVDRAGAGLIQQDHVRGSQTISIPDCGQTGDCVFLIGTSNGASQVDIGVESPPMSTKHPFGWGAIDPARGSNGAYWVRKWSSALEQADVITMDNSMDMLAVVLLRGFNCQSAENGITVNSGTFFLGPAVAPSNYPNPVTDTAPLSMASNVDQDLMVAFFTGSSEVADANFVNDLGILKELEFGPRITDPDPTFLRMGIGSRSVASQENWDLVFSSFDISSAAGWQGLRIRIS